MKTLFGFILGVSVVTSAGVNWPSAVRAHLTACHPPPYELLSVPAEVNAFKSEATRLRERADALDRCEATTTVLRSALEAQ